MDELREWIRAAQAVRVTCCNAPAFDVLIEQQKQRLEVLSQLQKQRLEELERISFGSNHLDLPISETDLPVRPELGRKPRRTAEEAAIDEQLRKEREAEDLDAFLPCYERATGLAVRVEEEAENPDFIARRSDELEVGIELTAVRQGPEDGFYRPLVTGNSEWDPNDALDQMWHLIQKKSAKISIYRTEFNILVLLNEELNFTLLCALALTIPLEDFVSSGFSEIWLADYSGIRSGAHREIELLGLYPEKFRTVIRRSDHDRKPYR